MPIEIKPEYLLETGENQFSEFYKSSAVAKAVIKQTFSYMPCKKFSPEYFRHISILSVKSP
jgi:hypothetical protein